MTKRVQVPLQPQTFEHPLQVVKQPSLADLAVAVGVTVITGTSLGVAKGGGSIRARAGMSMLRTRFAGQTYSQGDISEIPSRGEPCLAQPEGQVFVCHRVDDSAPSVIAVIAMGRFGQPPSAKRVARNRNVRGEVHGTIEFSLLEDAITQLHRVAELPGVLRAVGMPDLHPGKGVPIGAVAVVRGFVYPHLAGNDIGCGMALWQTGLPARKLKLDRWVRKLGGLEYPWDGDISETLAEVGIAPTVFDRSLGTIGGGNHFAELQVIHEVKIPGAMTDIGLDEDKLVLLTHSGSRGVGESVLRDHINRFGAAGLTDGSAEASQYLSRYEHAARWAKANRALIARRFPSLLGGEGRPVLDLCLNSITQTTLDGQFCWLHRKGAAPSDSSPVVIPGSRGTLSYLVAPCGDQTANAFSVAHGAGRKWPRTDARDRLERQYSVESLQRTDFGGRVICDDKDLLYEEAPQAYKNIDIVVQDLVNAGLIRVLATLRPLITYKTRIHEQ